MIAKAESHISKLARQQGFFDLRDALRSDFSAALSFRAKMGSHYNDEGYSPHVDLSVDFLDDDGNRATAESDSESGYMDDEGEQFEELRELIARMPDEVFKAIARQQVDCRDERALALLVMGAEGFAEYEAEVLSRAAKAGGAAGEQARL